jgi:uncharacterized protein
MIASAPGWYPDPWNPDPERIDAHRYWNGTAWTASCHAVARRRPPHPTLPFAVAVGALLSIGIPLAISRVVMPRLAHHHLPIVLYVAIAALIGYGPPMAFWVYAGRRWSTGRGRRDDVGLHFRAVDLGWGPLTWLACFGGELIAAMVVIAFKIPFQSNTQSFGDLRSNRGYVISLLVLAVLLAPIVEEIVFRGMVLRGFLSRMPAVAAIILQAVLFGAAHFSPERGVKNVGLILILSTVGGVLGGATYLVRRLAPNMIAHGILNGVAMALVLSGWHPRVS